MTVPTAKNLMILGTGSDVGKSILVAGLCRILKQDGYRVAPFKAQNMALNSYITLDGGEMGRAQVVQAEAAGIEPHVDMNPILLKPTSNVGSQIIVHGKVLGNFTAEEYYLKKIELVGKVMESYRCLEEKYDVLILEGAGSAAEVNLRDKDLVNLSMAERANAPVVLVADIDRGGVFASLVGHMELFTAEEKQMVRGFIINKFRGDPSLLASGLEFIEARTGKPVLGLVHYFTDIHIPEEDSVALDLKVRLNRAATAEQVRIGVIRLPHISNYTDFDSLEQEPAVSLSYFNKPEEVFDQDLVILPGSKNTLSDLLYLREQGLAEAIISFHAEGGIVAGICGGYQMLGLRVLDPLGVESGLREMNGLNLLNMETELLGDKVTTRVKAKVLWEELAEPEEQIHGYEIHMGRSKVLGTEAPLLEIVERNGKPVKIQDGLVSHDGRVWGSYVHGFFDNDGVRHCLINHLRTEGRVGPTRKRVHSFHQWKEEQYDKLADHLRLHLDLERIYQIIGL
ncbi:MAG: cobyric acid synthase [Deltaproteobacteria bacterium]|nr:MAG: cobyric acid synthase [Deltaproteobacteria bacterium]